ncbi:MAG TPA: GntR family transcriptional regulator [Acetobacteraceae bacterium]|nr:GntR family transcriptional regulator [Acetobacteraceae bacterium]
MSQPAYLRILHALRARIAAGEWRVGDQIPTDEELMALFGVSRFTVRAALDVLVADGVIKRYRRRGSFVAARPDGASAWMLTSLDDLVMHGFPTEPILLDVALLPCPEPVAGVLGLDAAAPALRIRALRTADGAPYSHSVIHIPEAFTRNFPPDWESRVSTEPFVSLVANANALPVHRAIQVARAVAAEGEAAAMLQVTAGTPLLVLERTFHSRDGVVLEHAEIACRPDRYRQIIEFRSTNAATREDSC